MTLLTVQDVAKILNVKPCTVYVFVSRGMPHVKLSPRCIRFEEEGIQAWIEKCRVVGPKRLPGVYETSRAMVPSKIEREYRKPLKRKPRAVTKRTKGTL